MPYSLDGIERLGETPAPSAQLPSMHHGIALLKGDLSKVFPAMGVYLFRTAQLAAGIALTGNWTDKSLRHAMAGSSAVQLFVLSYALFGGLHEHNKLPSAASAEAFLNGEPGGTRDLILCWLGRSALIGTGMAVAGSKKNVVPQALAGGTIIELVVLLWALEKRNSKNV